MADEAAAEEEAIAPVAVADEGSSPHPWDSETEWDLSSVDGCIGYIVSSFPIKDREKVAPLSDFYVRNQLRPQVSKAWPLYMFFFRAR